MPDIVLNLLQLFKDNHDIYKNATIIPSNIPSTLVYLLFAFENANAEC